MEKSSYLKAGSEGQSPDSAPSCAEAGGSTASPPAGGALQAAAGGHLSRRSCTSRLSSFCGWPDAARPHSLAGRLSSRPPPSALWVLHKH